MTIPRMPQPAIGTIPCVGGCDFVTPSWMQRAGAIRLCQNVEMGLNMTYDTIKGYERFDGRTAPSSATYTILTVTISGSISLADTVTGATSGATGYVIAIAADNSYIVVTKKTGTFNASENLEVSAAVEAVTTAAESGGAATSALNATYLNLAADAYRTDITAVPGSGPIRGVCSFNGTVYAWRNNAGGTALVMHKESTSGWTEVALGRELSFTSGGTTEIAEGDTITGATSGATAVITRVCLQSGTWAGGDAAGRLIFASQTGTFQAENLDVGASLNLATIAGDSSAITLLPGGRVKHIQTNFGGATGTTRIYGCDGANRGFEFDGTVYAPIATGMATDIPENVAAHKFHLFFSFGSSVQHSGIAAPFSWTLLTGANELGVGDDVTGFSAEMGSEAGAALGIISRNRIHVLYGNDSSDWNLIKYRDEVGGYENSIQDIGMTVMMDDRGWGAFRATDRFGNFSGATLSESVQPWLNTRKSTVTDSCIVREKNQVRYFFEDETALYITHKNGKVLGMMTQKLADKVECIHSAESTTGREEIYFGSDDGYVYQMEKGTSFDGDNIEVFLMWNYFNDGSPSLLKTWKGVEVEATGAGYSAYSLGYELQNSDVSMHQPTGSDTSEDYETTQNYLEARWDSFTWDNFYWDGAAIGTEKVKMVGNSTNVGFIIYSDSDEYQPISFSGIRPRYIPRRIKR